MDLKQAGSSLDSLISSFNTRIIEIQELVIGRNIMYAATGISDLSAVDTAVKAMEFQMETIKNRLREEAQAIPKSKKLIDMSLPQQNKLEHMFSHIPSKLPQSLMIPTSNPNRYKLPSYCKLKFWEKKGRGSAPLWYITAEDYMKGRLTLDKVNATINDMDAYAETRDQLISTPKKNFLILSLFMIWFLSFFVKGKFFFVELDIKGPSLKLENTGKSILTVLRHLGRTNETRIGHHRVIILPKPLVT
ncbi:hypothetical protein MKX01_040367 [Papaver californicum]|nr:hypothetical protein MKX01_040367 [Papaver californicum]